MVLWQHSVKYEIARDSSRVSIRDSSNRVLIEIVSYCYYTGQYSKLGKLTMCIGFLTVYDVV